MADIALLTNQEDVFSFGADASGTPHQAGFTVTTAPYPDGYCVITGTDIHFVPTKAGSYTVTLAGHSEDGTVLTSVVKTFAVTEPPPVQATELVFGPDKIRGKDITTPADPGNAVLSGTLNPGQ